MTHLPLAFSSTNAGFDREEPARSLGRCWADSLKKR